jgi:hypothetical protein
MNKHMDIDDGTPLYRVAMLALMALSKEPEEGSSQRTVQCMKFTVRMVGTPQRRGGGGAHEIHD